MFIIVRNVHKWYQPPISLVRFVRCGFTASVHPGLNHHLGLDIGGVVIAGNGNNWIINIGGIILPSLVSSNSPDVSMNMRMD
jgi:hypothetical protein